ncbi:MAG: GAF domain-containing protein, partial [Desulfobacteraceae bacterium]|nr:GAF domain-containing protein [Desulfobacteraceae bacterium]
MEEINPNDYQSLIRENQHIKTINQMLIDIANTISGTGSLDKLYRSIYTSLLKVTSVNNFYIVLHDENTDLLSFVFFEDEKDTKSALDINNVSNLQTSNTFTAKVIRTGKPMMVSKKAFLEGTIVAGNEKLGTPPEKWIGVPLKVRGKVIGAMATQTYSDASLLGQSDMDLLIAVSEHVGIAIERKQHEEAQIANENLTNTLFKISNAVNKTDNLKELYESIHHSLNRIIDLTNFYIGLYDKTSNKITFPYHVDEFDNQDEWKMPFLKTDSLSNEVFQAQKPVFLNQDELEERAAQNRIIGTKPLIWIGVPLLIRNEIKGIMVAQSYSNPNLYNQRDVDILSSVSEQVAIAIDRKRAEEALYESKEQIKRLSLQTEQFSLVAASIISMKEEKEIYNRICKAITMYSDFQRVVIVSFQEGQPFQQIASYDNVDPERMKHLESLNLTQDYYINFFNRGKKLGQFSYYISHVLTDPDNPADSYDEALLSTQWHKHDKLLVRMIDNMGQLIGVIAVDQSRSGLKPSDDMVRPLDIFASLISQIILYKKTQKELKQAKLAAEGANKAKSEFLANMSHE